MAYRVVITCNGEYKRTIHKSQTRETAFINYRVFKKQNESVFFPRRFINNGGIIPVEYQIMVVKDIEEGDKNRFVRDGFGKLYEEKPLSDKWTIIDSGDYNFEETFWVYGHDPKSDRLGIGGIVKKLMVGAYKQKMTKQIIVVHNKLVIHNEDQFDMVICKNKLDAQRLHHTLAKATRNNKIKSLIYMGTASPATVSRMYELIHDETGWPYTKIRRTSTRP